jgi:alcohol dehydrogenase
MVNNFSYNQPVKIEFGAGSISKLTAIAQSNGWNKGILICDKLFINNGLAQKIKESCLLLVDIYSDITPNPMLNEVRHAADLIKFHNADFVVALGGGSSMDLAKFACSMVYADADATEYFFKRKVFENKHIPLIAVPTTAGTGSEVTSVSVCNDEVSGVKAPLMHNNFFASYAIIDPELTLTVPPYVTATTGLDALSHALEAFWSKNHQPICDALALQSIKLIFDNLEKAYKCGSDLEVRTNMSLAALYAGLAFALPKTAGVHGCSYPLSIDYHLSHGEACAFTMDSFIKINADAENGRLNNLAKEAGFDNATSMANEVARLKKVMNLKCTLADCGIVDVEKLAKDCAVHPLLKNNPVNMDEIKLNKMFEELR